MSALSFDQKWRMAAVLLREDNKYCADCPAENPEWVTFITPKVEVDRPLHGVLHCTKCAQHHYFELADRRCKIKNSTLTHEGKRMLPLETSVKATMTIHAVSHCFSAFLLLHITGTIRDIDILEYSGNSFLNTSYEAHLTPIDEPASSNKGTRDANTKTRLSITNDAWFCWDEAKSPQRRTTGKLLFSKGCLLATREKIYDDTRV